MKALPDGFEFHDWSDDEVARYWDFIAQAQPEAYFTNQAGRHVLRQVRKQTNRATRIVDYGCGPGFLLEALDELGKPYAAFDVSERSRSLASARVAGSTRFLGAFGPDIPEWAKGSFDLAFCLEVVEHCDDATLDVVFASLGELLKPGGTLVVSTPNEEDLAQNWICSPETGRVFHRWQHVRAWDAASLAAALSAGGFRVEAVRACNLLAQGLSPRALAYRALAWSGARKPANLMAVAEKYTAPV